MESVPEFVLRGGTVVTLDASIGTLRRGDVFVRHGRIEQIAESVVVGSDVAIIDATDRIVLPGFIDTHRHTWQTCMRGMLASGTLGTYFPRVMVQAASQATAEDVYAGTLLGCYEMLDAGITSVVDWANVMNTPEHADASIAALQEAGIRAMFGYGCPGGIEYIRDSNLGHPVDAKRVAEQYFSSDNQLLSLGLALRAPGAARSASVVVNDWALARELDAWVTIHVGLRKAGSVARDVTVLDELGVLGPRCTYVHGNEVSPHELHRIAATGGTVSVAAYSEMLMGHGRPPIRRLLDAGLAPSLSADIVTSMPGDMFSHMRATYTATRMQDLPDDPTCPLEDSLDVEDILAMATRNGASALGLDHRIGTLSAGKDADIVTIRVDRPNAIPLNDPIATVVSQVDTSNIDSVFVRGDAVKRDGLLLGFDLARARRLAEASADRLGATEPRVTFRHSHSS